MSNNTRIKWLDACKGIGIILVIAGHTPLDPSIRGIIYGFHMPLFFLLSGYFFSMKKGDFLSFTITKIRSLLIPYLFFSFVSLFLLIFIFNQPVDLVRAAKDMILSSRNHIFFNQPLWFLTSLLVIEMIYFGLSKLLRNNYFILIVTLVSSILVVQKFGVLSSGVIFPWSIDQSLFYLVFFGIGHLLRTAGMLDKDLKKSPVILFLSLAFVIFVFYPSVFLKVIGLIGIPSIAMYLHQFLFALFGISFVIFVSQFLSFISLLNYIGRNSLILMALHIPLGFNLYHMWIRGKLGVTIENLNTFGLAVTIFTVIILLPVIYLINRYFPIMLGRGLDSQTIMNKHLKIKKLTQKVIER